MGYIGVLPGAFSAYMWRAIQGVAGPIAGLISQPSWSVCADFVAAAAGVPLHAYFKLEDKDGAMQEGDPLMTLP